MRGIVLDPSPPTLARGAADHHLGASRQGAALTARLLTAQTRSLGFDIVFIPFSCTVATLTLYSTYISNYNWHIAVVATFNKTKQNILTQDEI